MRDPLEGTSIDLAFVITKDYDTDCYTGPDYDEWIKVGVNKPNTWCNVRQCHGDADGLKEGNNKSGYFYVGAGDLNILLGVWKVSMPGMGYSNTQLGADFDHHEEGNPKSGYFRIGAGDLTILLAYWKILEPAVPPIPSGPGLPTDCLTPNPVKP